MSLSFANLARSAGAIFAGIGVNIVLSLALDGLFQGLGILPPTGQPMSETLHLLPFTYRVVIAIGGFYVTARLAPKRPAVHAFTLAAIAFALTVATTIASWNGAQAVQPHWFQVAMLTLLFPMAWLGARLATRRGAGPLAGRRQGGVLA